MYNEQTHPLLAQVPLTVSPFVSLPTATTLPYTYKSLPSTLPPSSTGLPPSSSNQSGSPPENNKPRFVVSSSGHAAHPDEIIASCDALQAHLKKTQDDAERTLKNWEQEIKDRDLAEKRRVAPGWLDTEERMLQPKRASVAPTSPTPPQGSLLDEQEAKPQAPANQPMDKTGEELDRAFGGMSVRGTG